MKTQQTKEIEVCHTVGNTEYSFDAQITYTVDIEEGDFMHPTFSDTIIDRIEYGGETLAYDYDKSDRVVTNTVELAKLRKSIDWEFELEKNL
jgi:YD repeat-containing protein